MAETNPGQQNLAYDAATNQPRLNVDTTYDDNTSLEDIQSKYTDIGDQYSRFVTDTRQNVADRQTEHIGNDFGTSPYNTNTYYEGASTGFASAMRQQGTQQAFEVGMDRGRKEAEANLEAAKNAYNNAATAYNDAYTQYQNSKKDPVAATIDKSLLPEGVNEDEFANYIQTADNPAQGLQRAIDTYGINNAGVRDWNDQAVVDKVKNTLGENSDAWKAYAQHMEERNKNNQYGVSERFGDTELGRVWADTYAKTYFQTYYDDSYVQAWQTSYDQTRRLVNNLMGLHSGELDWTSNIVPVEDLPDNMSVGTNFQYINIIQPEFKDMDTTAFEQIKVNQDGSYTIHGETYSYDEVRQRVAESQGKSVEELDQQAANSLGTSANLQIGNQKSQIIDLQTNFKNNPLNKKWTPSAKDIMEVFAKGDVVKDMYTGYETFSISADNVAQAVLGVDIKEAKAIAQMKAENPEGFATLTDQITRAITDATVLEVADGVKKYHTKDGYKVLDKGTVVMNIPDAVLNEDGSVRDEDLKRMLELYAERDDPTMNEEELMNEYEKAWRSYATRLAWARSVTNQTDEQISSDIYSALLYSQDPSKYKDVKIGDKTAEEALNEFRRKTETDPEGAYRDFTGWWEKAHENVGYFIVDTGSGLMKTPLYDSEGESLVGRYGEENTQKDVDSNYAMAMVSLIANSMDKFNSGSKDSNINPNFIEADGADDWNTWWTDLGKRLYAAKESVIAGAAGGIVAGPKGAIVGGLAGAVAGFVSGTIRAEDYGPGSFGYDLDRNNLSSELMRKSINPLSLSLWGLDDSGTTKFGESYELIRGVGDFLRDSSSFIAEMTIESIATAGLEAVGKTMITKIGNGVANASSKLLSAGQQLSIRSVADAAKSSMIQDLLDPSDELSQGIATRVATDLADPSDEIAQQYINNAAKIAANEVDDLADDVVEGATKIATRSTAAGKYATVQAMTDARVNNTITALNKVANSTTDDFMRFVSYMANDFDDFSDFAIKFSKEATKFITRQSVVETLAKAGYTNIDDAVVDVALEHMRNNAAQIGSISARQTYQTALISGFLGVSPDKVAHASSETLTYLSKAIGKWYDNPSLLSNFSGVWGAASTGKMSMESIKKSFAEILESSARATAQGIAYGKSDIIRTLARNGWSSQRLKLFFSDAVFRNHGLADDVLYDIYMGYVVPTIDEEGNAQTMNVEEYFTSGRWMFSLGVNAVQMVGGAAFRRIQSSTMSKSMDKAQRALSATAVDDPTYGKRFAKVQKLAVKAEKLSNKIMDNNLDFSKMKEVAERGHQYIDEANTKLFEGLSKDAKSVDKNAVRKTIVQQAEYLQKRYKAPDAVAQSYINAQTDAFITFPQIKRALGGDKMGTLATMEDRTTLGKIWKIMADVADKYRMELKNNKRYKTIWDKQTEMRRLQKEAVMDAFRGADGTSAISDLESSLDSWFNLIDDVAKKNVASGAMTEAQVRLGYLPMTGMLIGEPGDGVPTAARGIWLGDKDGHAMAVSSADPVMKRELDIQQLIKAYQNGEKSVTYVTSNGSTKTVEFNPQGFEFADAAVTYRNSNNFHRTVGAILGGDSKSTGAAAVETGYVQIHGEKISKAAATADKAELNTQIGKMEADAKAKMTEELSAKDARARKRAEKALSNLARQEDSLLKRMGKQNVAASDMREAAKILTQLATEGRRPENAPSARELLGLKSDSEAQKAFDSARKRIVEDIKKVQAGEKLTTNDLHSKVTVPEDGIYYEMITNAAKNHGHFDYDVVARRMLLDYKDMIYEMADNGSHRLTVSLLKNNPDKVYLFGDNIADAKSGFVPKSTQAVVRGQSNAIGIPTKKNRFKNVDSYFTDNDFAEFKKGVDDAISKAKKSGKQIIVPAEGIGTGAAQLATKAPKCFEYLERQLAQFGYETSVMRRARLSGVGSDSVSDDTVKFMLQSTDVKLTWDKNTKKMVPSTMGELSKIDMDKAKNKNNVIKALTDMVSENSGVSSDRGLKEQYMRVVQDAFSQAQTIMNDQVKLDTPSTPIGPDGGFARGFFTYLDIVDRLLPDMELYNTAVNSKLINKLNALGKDGITLQQLKESVLAKISTEKAAGNDIADLVTTYKVLDLSDEAGARAAGTGDYIPGNVKGGVFDDESDDAMGTFMGEGVVNIFGKKVDTDDAYAADFNAENLFSERDVSPAQIDYNKLSAKEKTIYDMVRSGIDLGDKETLNKALETTAKTLNKLTNNGSKLYDPGLRAAREETAGLFKIANDIRDEINKAVNELAKTDKETKSLIDAEVARRTARQKKYGKNSQTKAEYDGSAALGIARPGSAVLYSDNPARYNAIASSLRNGEAGLANDVTGLRGQGVPDAESILGYLRQNEPGVENLDSLINFDAGSPAGIYHQLRHAALYLKEKGYDTSKLGTQLNELKSKLGGNLDNYGDIYGNYNPPEFSLAAALAEVEGKASFFPDNLRNGVDRMKEVNASHVPSHSGWKDTGHPNFKTEFTEAGESTNPGSVIASLNDGESGNENLKLHLVDDNGDPVDISELAAETRIKNFSGLILENAGPNGETVHLSNDGGSLRAEYEITRGFDDLSETPLRKGQDAGNPLDEKWTEYLVATKDKKTKKELLDEAAKLEKRAAKADKKAEKLAGQRVDVEDEIGNVKKKSVKTLVEDSQDINYKKYMSPEDYDKYVELKTMRQQADDFIEGKSEVYHAVNGTTFNGKAAGYSNNVRISDFLQQYGYDISKKKLNPEKMDLKTMKKELRASNLAAKKNWGKAAADATPLPSKMDLDSAALTVKNILNFAKQIQEKTGMTYVDLDQIWVDKSYLELLARYANSPNNPTGLIGFASKVSALPQWIQQQQLAGGWGPMNALTLAQVRSAILEDPMKALTFARMLADMRNSKTAVTSILERSDLLARITMDTMDGSIVTDLYPAISKRAGRNDGGVLQTFATKILDRADGSVDKFPKGFRANLKADLEDFFENPTFMQAMPVLRAQMISMNYDSALSNLRKKFADRIGKDIALEELEDAARLVAYNKTQKFFTPQKYWSGNMEAGMQKIKNQNLRKMVGQITGEGTPTTVMDIASSAFFALRYKQTFVNRFVQGVKSYTNVPRMLKNQLSSSANVMDVAQDLTNVGQMKGIASLIGIAVLAKVWCDAMGVPNAWDDFDFTPEGDEVFHMPTVLMKFQNAGQIWLPNDTKEDGTPYVNPNKQAWKLDPMFSMFTLPNSAMRAINTAFNGQTDNYKAPQRGLPFLPQNGIINSVVNSNVGRAIGDELIGSNLLSPFKAMHEIVTNSTYFGNNIWERKYLPDGRENPNYDPGRNAASSVMHLLGLDTVLDPNGYNRWVKGGDNMVKQDQIGTISGSGILQHEYWSAAIKLMEGDLFGAFTEAGELPLKTQKLSTTARTEMNNVVKNTLDHYGDEYREKIKNLTNVELKDEAYAEYVKKCADEVARWSAKYDYLLGENQELVASATRMLMAMTAGEYDDHMAYVQNAYWKASQIAQIESGTNLFLKDGDLDEWLANGGTIESFAEEKSRRSQAYNQALDEEYDARKALIDAGYNPEYLAGSSYEDLRSEQRSVSKKIYESIMTKFNKSVGEFDNYKELQQYYEEMIANASTTKQKAKLAKQYNAYVTDIIAEAIGDYGPAVLNESTYNGKGITQQISDYIIIPADVYYTGKSPKSNYLKDYFGVGYRNTKNLPSDSELLEKWDTVKWLTSHGKPASASAILEEMVKNIKDGRWYASDADYSDIIKLKSRLRSKQ